MSVVLLSTAYLAPVSYYILLAQAPKCMIEQHESYQKQSYRNRCLIAGANGPLTLSIPVQKSLPGQNRIRDIRLSTHGNWRHLHWHSLLSAYGSSPYFDYYQDDLRPHYERDYRFLFDFNEALRVEISALIGLDVQVEYTADYHQDTSMLGEAMQDYRNSLHPKKPVLGDLSDAPYFQVFDSKFGFQPDLSVVDLLFNLGPEAYIYLMQQQ